MVHQDMQINRTPSRLQNILFCRKPPVKGHSHDQQLTDIHSSAYCDAALNTDWVKTLAELEELNWEQEPGGQDLGKDPILHST